MNRLPTRDELVAFIRERSGKVGVREIARAFGAKNSDRAALNRMLRDLARTDLAAAFADEGDKLVAGRKAIHWPRTGRWAQLWASSLAHRT